jgi:excisionase family DNA binding protein
MLSAIGPDPNDPQPQPTPEAARKAATAKRLCDESTATRNNVIHRLRTRGAVYKPDRRCPPDPKWDSSSPNHGYLNAYVSGIYGTAEDRKLEGFDVGAFERAKAIFAVSTHRPWKGLVQGDQVFVQTTLEDGHWEPIAAQPCAVAPEARSYTPDRTTGTTGKRVTKEGINKAYEAYALNPVGELGNMEAALYAFASTNGRWAECDSLLKERESYLQPDDIIADFAADLIDRFKKGQYHTHEGKVENWIRHVWQTWFFPDVQTNFYAESNLTCAVNEDDFDNDEVEAEDRVSGETYRVDVDMDQANRDKESWNDPARLLDRMLRLMDDPKTVWSRVNDSTKKIIRAMVGGATKAEAAALAGLSERDGRREFENLTKLASANPEMREQLFVSRADVGKGGNVICISACAEFSPQAVDMTLAQRIASREQAWKLEELASLLNCSRGKLYAMVKANRIPFIRVGSMIRFDPKSTASWIIEKAS